MFFAVHHFQQLLRHGEKLSFLTHRHSFFALEGKSQMGVDVDDWKAGTLNRMRREDAACFWVRSRQDRDRSSAFEPTLEVVPAQPGGAKAEREAAAVVNHCLRVKWGMGFSIENKVPLASD